MSLNAERIACSTITLRHLPLEQALATITSLGFEVIDLGALPGVCDHVPYVLDEAAVEQVAATVNASGLAVRSINADVGDLNAVLDDGALAARERHVHRLLDLAVAIGSDAIVLPNGRQSHDAVESFEADLDRVVEQLTWVDGLARARSVELWVEAPHFFRFLWNEERSAALYERLPETVGAVCDVSHIVASEGTPRAFLDRFAGRTRHVHLRDAEKGYIHHSVGNGQVDFADLAASLTEHGYEGVLALELETRDVEDDDRPAAALAAGELVSDLLAAVRA